MKKSVPFIIHFFRFYFNTIGIVFKKNSSQKLIQLFSTPRNRVVREKEKEVLSTARQFKKEIGTDELKIYEWGTGTKLAILFHGWESNAGSLGAFVNPLLKMDYRIIAFDAPAHGQSKGKRANLIYFKEAAKQIILQYGTPDLAIGHSLGANSIIMTSLEEAYAFKKVILISPLNRLMTVFEEMKELLKIPDKLFEKFITAFGESSGYELNDFYFHDYGTQTKLKEVMLFHDVNDRVTSFSHAKDFDMNWNQIKLIPIEGSGHYKILWDEGMVLEAIKYIEI